MYELLDRIDSPADLRTLDEGQLGQLCSEIREYMIEVCSRNPGHLASSLGCVELIVGAHYVFDTPDDKIVFDVGHQAYAHKILTGRREAFRTQRTAQGISGFPRIQESPFDAFGAGHSSTSISAALGIAEAFRQQDIHRKVIALIGDGALTGGLAFEGLNNAGDQDADLLVIINDNNQSIDKNIGGLHKHLLNLTTSNNYNRLKDKVWEKLGDRGLRAFLQRWVRSFKSWIVKKSGGDLFESLGFRYFGPVDGNDIRQVIATLRRLKGMTGPRILHCITTKGKGYVPAEKDPVVWHAPGRFDPSTGERIISSRKADRYQDVFGEVLCELAACDPRIVGVTPAMASGCGMNRLQERMPDRFYDVGIEEEHAVTFSAGLAAGGMLPFCNIYSAFSQRAYDQIIHDVALQDLPVVLCFDRAGLVGEDGATHHGAFDITAYRPIPGAVISAPADEAELRNLMHTAARKARGPFIIRYPRGMGEGIDWKNSPVTIYNIGEAEEVVPGSRIAVICSGPFVGKAKQAAAAFQEGEVGVYNFRFIKPLDTEMLDKIVSQCRSIITVEDGALKGGLYGAVCEYIASKGTATNVQGIGLPDSFVPQGKQDDQRSACGLSTEGIRKAIESMTGK